MKEWIGYTAQFLFSVLTATILISRITGTNVAAGMVSAGISTIFFLLVTKGQIPICLSNSGNTVSGIVMALGVAGAVAPNFAGVLIGGITIALVYCLAAIFVKKYGTEWLTKILDPLISGCTVLVIGCTLSFFSVSYAQINGEYSLLGVCIAFFVAILTAVIAHYGKGIVKRLPFLIGLLGGYFVCILLTLIQVPGLINLNELQVHSLFSVPDFAFFHLDFVNFNWASVPQIIVVFALLGITGISEHISDVTATSAIVGKDYVKNNLHQTLIADGVGSTIGCIIAGPTNCTYSEYVATIAVSKVASTAITLTTALSLIFLGFFTPFNVLLSSISNVCFAGTSLAAYGAIAYAGLKTLLNGNIDWNSNKTMMIFGIMITTGISGLTLSTSVFSLSGIPLAMIVGVILNLLLKNE